MVDDIHLRGGDYRWGTSCDLGGGWREVFIAIGKNQPEKRNSGGEHQSVAEYDSPRSCRRGFGCHAGSFTHGATRPAIFVQRRKAGQDRSASGRIHRSAFAVATFSAQSGSMANGRFFTSSLP